MLGGWPSGGIFLSVEPADMRCSFDGLSALVSSRLGRNPCSGSWYIFINRRRTMVKVLGFEPGGYFIWSKRLEQGLFAPAASDGGPEVRLSPTETMALLDGIDVAIRGRRKRYDVARPAGSLARLH